MLPSPACPVIIWCCAHLSRRIAGGQSFAVTEVAAGWIIATFRFDNTNLFSLPERGPPRGHFKHVAGPWDRRHRIGRGGTMRRQDDRLSGADILLTLHWRGDLAWCLYGSNLCEANQRGPTGNRSKAAVHWLALNFDLLLPRITFADLAYIA